MDSQENHENEIQPLWYFRSDDNPMENNGINEKWNLYPDSEVIEANFQYYLNSKNEYDDQKHNPNATLELDSNYFLDFRENVQKNMNDSSKLRLVGRFEGDTKTKNTLNYLDSIIIKKVRIMKNLTDNDPKSIKSSQLFEGDEAFVNYNFLDLIFKIIDKVPNEKQAIEDLIQYSVNYISTYENQKEKETLKLKELVIDLENEKFK